MDDTMKKLLYLASLVVAVGVLAGSACAQTFHVTATPDNGLSSGQWTAVLTNLGVFDPVNFPNDNVWTVQVNPDVGVNVPNHAAEQISVGFYPTTNFENDNLLHHFVQPDLATTDPFSTHFDWNGNPPPNPADTVRYQRSGTSGPLATTADEFDGFAYTPVGFDINSVIVTVQDGNGHWTGADITPEPGSLALFLPSLAGLGGALVRRRRKV